MLMSITIEFLMNENIRCYDQATITEKFVAELSLTRLCMAQHTYEVVLKNYSSMNKLFLLLYHI